MEFLEMREAFWVIALIASGLLVAREVASAQSATAGSKAPKIIEVSAKKYEFTPSEIHVQKTAKVEVKVHSVDETHGIKLNDHAEGTDEKSAPGLVVDEPNENGKVKKHMDQVIDFTAEETGTYAFKCTKLCGFGHRGMKGKLIVDE